MILIKWKGDPNVEEKHKYDYRWIEDKRKRKEWIKKNWVVKK